MTCYDIVRRTWLPAVNEEDATGVLICMSFLSS